MSLLYSTLTATTFNIYTLINIRIYSSSAPTTSSILTLTVALTRATLGIR